MKPTFRLLLFLLECLNILNNTSPKPHHQYLYQLFMSTPIPIGQKRYIILKYIDFIQDQSDLPTLIRSAYQIDFPLFEIFHEYYGFDQAMIIYRKYYEIKSFSTTTATEQHVFQHAMQEGNYAW